MPYMPRQLYSGDEFMMKSKWKCTMCATLYTYYPNMGMCTTNSCMGTVEPLMTLIGYVDEDGERGLYQRPYCKTILISRTTPTCGAEHDL